MGAADLELPFGHPKRMISLGQGFAVDLAIINYGRWVKKVNSPFVSIFFQVSHTRLQHVVSGCSESAEKVTIFTKRWYYSCSTAVV